MMLLSSSVLISGLGLDGLRNSGLGLKHGSFCPFLADLRGVRWASGIITLPDYKPASERLKMGKSNRLTFWQWEYGGEGSTFEHEREVCPSL